MAWASKLSTGGYFLSWAGQRGANKENVTNEAATQNANRRRERRLPRSFMRICYCGTVRNGRMCWIRSYSGFPKCAYLNSSPVSMMGRLRFGDKTMSVSEQVRPLLAARAATDPNAARLLEMLDKANELLERSPYKYGDVEIFETATF